jgi:uncharacterized protein YfdQ (DUF2303 family)
MSDDVNLEQAHTNAAVGYVAGYDRAEEKALLEATIHRITENARPYRILADGSLVNMEGYLSAPVMRRADVTVHDSISFAAYIKRFGEDATIIFADKTARSFTSVLDYHEPGVDGLARWGRHRVSLPLRYTPSWLTWTQANKKPMGQIAFSEFLEDNIPDIADPLGAEIVEIARSLEAKKAVEFKSQIRMEDGSHRFTFNEDVSGSAKSGSLEIPAVFTLGLVPFEGATEYKITARFRYRLEGGKLSLWFDLVRLEDTLDAAFFDERDVIANAVGKDTPILAGPAPAVQKAE